MSGERNGIERVDILNDILEERREFEGRLEHQLNRLEQLIGALVNISRMETGMIRLQPETGRIFDPILEAVNGIWVNAQKKNIEIQMDAGDDIEDLMISHDRKWLCEALLNLLDNGVKYSPSGTVITIRALRMTSFLRIEIQDQGIGIPRENYHKVFQRFFRGTQPEVLCKYYGKGENEVKAVQHANLDIQKGGREVCYGYCQYTGAGEEAPQSAEHPFRRAAAEGSHRQGPGFKTGYPVRR